MHHVQLKEKQYQFDLKKQLKREASEVKKKKNIKNKRQQYQQYSDCYYSLIKLSQYHNCLIELQDEEWSNKYTQILKYMRKK